MTLEEKVAQLGAVRAADLVDDNHTFDRAAADSHLQDGVGHITRPGSGGHLTPTETAAFNNAVQEYLREETRLGIPAISHEESLMGYMGPGGTTYPQAIGLAATWDPELVETMSGEIHAQLAAIGTAQSLSPVLDLARDQRWGRIEETYGEDQYLAARMASAYVAGIQDSGDGPRDISSTPKHLAGHGATAGGKNRSTLHLGPRRLDEHLFPFAAAIRVAGADSVMNAYHDVDGVPCAASEELLTETLRESWGFDGTVVADYHSVEFLETEHGVAGSNAEAAIQALEAGIDVELPISDCYETLPEAVERGDIAEATIDTAVRRVLQQKASLGLFEQPTVETESVERVFETDDQRALARTLARQSITLLSNDGVLPLENPSSVALIGPKVDSPAGQLGDYAYPARKNASDRVDLDIVTPDTAIRDRLGDERVTTVEGCTVTGSDTSGFEDAAGAAADSAVAIAFVGARSAIGGPDEESEHVDTSGEGSDVSDLGLPGQQSELLAALRETGTPLVVVQISGRPHAVETAPESDAALLHAWLPGECGGPAIADVVFGDHSPSGRLPVSIPRSVGQLPVHYNRHPNTAQEEYVFEDADPLFPFGHGESYTSFSYGECSISPGEIKPAGQTSVDVSVENTGDVAGAEVVQLYVHHETPSVVRPVQQLLGFQRVELAPGERATVSFDVTGDQLALLDRDLNRVVEPGEYEFRIGHSASDIRTRCRLSVSGQTWNVPASARTFFTDTRVS
jgi:beta-glucosidase